MFPNMWRLRKQLKTDRKKEELDESLLVAIMDGEGEMK